MAAVEGFERGYLGTLMRLTLLSPAMVEAILNWQLLDWVPVRLGGGGFLADLLSRWGYDEPTILPALRRFGENMPERSAAAPSRSVAKPLRIHGSFKSSGPGRISFLEDTGAGIKTGKVKLSEFPS